MAERHWINGGVNNLWGTTGNWSLTEGGAGGQAVPVVADDVFFDAGSPACTVNSQNRVCKTFTAASYAATLTFTYSISVSGNITVGTSMGWSGTGQLIMLVAGTWTSNGATIGADIKIGDFTAGTVTLADDLTTSGDLSLTNATSTTFSGDFHITAATCTITGGQTVTIVHDVTITGLTTIVSTEVLDGLFNWNTGGLTVGGAFTGTTPIVLTGGTWQETYVCSKNVTLAGDVTISGTILYAASGTPTLTYSSGTITTTGSTLSIATACTLNTNGMSWANITLSAALTLTISSPLTLTGNFTISAASTLTINGLLTVAGTLTLPNAAVTFAGISGFTVGTLTNTAITATRIYTFEEAITYTITTDWTCVHTAAQTVRFTVTSADGATKAIITLNYGATQKVFFLDPTRIDSSLGQPIFSFTGAITDSYNWSNDLGHGRIIPEAGGESVTVAGITKDNAGVALGSCDVYLFRDNGGDTATYIAYVESGAADGTYSFTVFPGSTYFVVAFKGGATPVMDVTDRTVTAV